MNIKKYDETKRLIIDLIDSLYPHHECIMLTGSTLEPLYHRPQSDIDVVVVSKEFTGTTSHLLRHRGNVIDITRVGYFQLPDILIENCYNSTGILLTMFATCKILRDHNDLAATLRAYAMELSAAGNLAYRNDAYSLMRSLVKLRKHISKRLDRTFDFFLMCDAARLFAQCHLFLSDGGRYMQDSFRTVKHIDLTDGNRRFAEAIAEICRMAYCHNDKKLIACYADYYISALKHQRNDTYCSTRFIIDIGLPVNVHTEAMKILHDHIIGDSILSTQYLYGYSTLKNNIYREGIVLIFDATADGFDRHFVLHRIYDILTFDSVEASSIDIIDDRYRRYRMPEAAVEDRIDALLHYMYLYKQNNDDPLLSDRFASIIVHTAARLGIDFSRRRRIMSLAAVAARPRNIISNNMGRKQIEERNIRFEDEMDKISDSVLASAPICDKVLSSLCDDLSAIVVKSDFVVDPVTSHLFASVGLQHSCVDICFVVLAASTACFLPDVDKPAYFMSIGTMPNVAMSCS